MTSTGRLGHEPYVPAHRRPRRYTPAHLCTAPAPAPAPAPGPAGPARRAALLVAVPALAGLAAAAPGAGGAPATPAVPGAVSLGRLALASATDRTYTVRAGDTLYAIATRFGTTVADLAARNHLTDPNRISVGQVLVVAGPATGPTGAPAPSRPSAPATVGGSYTVRAGDTLGAIAARFGTTVARLAATNRIADPNRISVGEVIRLPGAPPPAHVTAAGGPRATPAAPRPAGVAGRYTVRAGDTLGAIAARFGTTVGRLAAFNHVANPNQIVVGQVIRIPGRGVATSSSSATPAGAASPGAGGTTTGGTTTGAAAPGAPESAQAAVAVRTALAQVGKPYQWAGAGPDSFDCSGLVMYAWEAAGVFLPHYTVSQMDDTTRIRASQLEPGDIVFYDTPSGAQPGHEAMYIGGGQVVSANNVGTDVQTQSITYDGPPVAFGRVG